MNIHYFHRWWFLGLIGLFAAVAIAGLYIVLAGAIPRLPPRSWTSSDHEERVGIDAEDTEIELGEGSIRGQTTGIRTKRGLLKWKKPDIE